MAHFAEAAERAAGATPELDRTTDEVRGQLIASVLIKFDAERAGDTELASEADEYIALYASKLSPDIRISDGITTELAHAIMYEAGFRRP